MTPPRLAFTALTLLLSACSGQTPTEPTGTLYWREALAEVGLAQPSQMRYPRLVELSPEQAVEVLEPCMRISEYSNCAELLFKHHPELRGDLLTRIWPRCLESMEARFVPEMLLRSAFANAGATAAAMRQPRHRQANRLAIMTTLLAAGAPADVRVVRGSTPLHIAADDGDSALVALLLQHGADPTLTDGDGLTALQLAQAQGAEDVVRLLRR